jgi:hypothetical protein
VKVSRGTPVAALIVLGGGFHFKPIERAPLLADANLSQVRPDFVVEPVLVHAEEVRRVAQADETRDRSLCRVRELPHHEPKILEIQRLTAGTQFPASAMR